MFGISIFFIGINWENYNPFYSTEQCMFNVALSTKFKMYIKIWTRYSGVKRNDSFYLVYS